MDYSGYLRRVLMIEHFVISLIFKEYTSTQKIITECDGKNVLKLPSLGSKQKHY